MSGSIAVCTVMDTPSSAQRPYAFESGLDGHLWVDWWSGSQWSWEDLGPPAAGVRAGSIVGACTVMDELSSAQRPYVFVCGSDRQLWLNQWTGGRWVWDHRGAPAGVTVESAVGVCTMRNAPSSEQRPYAFVTGSDGHLWLHAWIEGRWRWGDNGAPAPGVTVKGAVGVCTVMDKSSSAQRPYVFVRGSDGHLWLDQWTGGQWVWQDLGTPGEAVALEDGVGVCTVKDGPAAPQCPYVFVLGTDRHLWVNGSSGSLGPWTDLGTPASDAIAGSHDVCTVMNDSSSAQRPHVFVQSANAQLALCWWTGSQWTWEDHGSPGGVMVAGPGRACTVMDRPGAPQRPYVFVRGSDDHLWMNWWTEDRQWVWDDQPAKSLWFTIDREGIHGEVWATAGDQLAIRGTAAPDAEIEIEDPSGSDVCHDVIGAPYMMVGVPYLILDRAAQGTYVVDVSSSGGGEGGSTGTLHIGSGPGDGDGDGDGDDRGA